MSAFPPISGSPRESKDLPFYDETHPAFTSLEACRVMGTFGHPPIWFHDELAKLKRINPAIPGRSLFWLANALKKSPRQVRRYCELGLVPGARRTAGGHWRVTAGRRVLAAVRKAVRAFERKRHTTKFPLPPEVRAMIRSRPPRFDNSPPEKPLRVAAILQSWDYLSREGGFDPDAMAAGNYGAEALLEMRQRPAEGVRRLAENRPFELAAATAVAAIRQRAGWRLTRRNLAAAIGVSRSTLYRKLSSAQIARIISGGE